MKKLNRGSLLAFVLATIATVGAQAAQIECSSAGDKVLAMTNPDNHIITRKFQFDDPPLQTLLSSHFVKAGRGCVVAHLSGEVRITDNYVVFQVTIDGVPMLGGQLTGLAINDTPVVFVTIIDTDEQFADPTKVASFNFFAEVGPGPHTVEVKAAAGSGIADDNQPRASSLVLTLEYK